MKRTIEIGNKTFNIMKETSLTEQEWKDGCTYINRTIYDCYAKPSVSKKSIYQDWKHWAEENQVDYLTVPSFNVNMFTLSGVIEINNIKYVFIVTTTRQELYQLAN